MTIRAYSAYTYRAQVARVVDGDTIDVLIDLGLKIYTATRLRIRGIDTPELRDRDLLERTKAQAAANRVLELAPVGSDIVIETHKDKRGKFGRYLADVTLADGRDLGAVLVAEGHARPTG